MTRCCWRVGERLGGLGTSADHKKCCILLEFEILAKSKTKCVPSLGSSIIRIY